MKLNYKLIIKHFTLSPANSAQYTISHERRTCRHITCCHPQTAHLTRRQSSEQRAKCPCAVRSSRTPITRGKSTSCSCFCVSINVVSINGLISIPTYIKPAAATNAHIVFVHLATFLFFCLFHSNFSHLDFVSCVLY